MKLNIIVFIYILGEFLHLADSIVPKNIKPALSDLVAYALEGRPSTKYVNYSASIEEFDQVLCSSEDRFIFYPVKTVHPEKSEIFIGDNVKKSNAMAAISALAKLYKTLNHEPMPATIGLYHAMNLFGPKVSMLRYVTHKKQSKHKGAQSVLTKECEDFVKESGVLIVKEAVAWKWDPIRSALKVNIITCFILLFLIMNECNYLLLIILLSILDKNKRCKQIR